MRSDIHKRTASRQLRAKQPCPLCPGVVRFAAELRPRIHRFADSARLDQCLQLLYFRIIPPVIRNAKLHPMFPASGNHALGLRCVKRHRLLAQHMLAMTGSFNRMLRMERDRRSHVNRIDIRIAPHLRYVRKHFRYAISFRKRFQFCFIAPYSGLQAAASSRLQRPGHPSLHYVARPDYRPSNH